MFLSKQMFLYWRLIDALVKCTLDNCVRYLHFTLINLPIYYLVTSICESESGFYKQAGVCLMVKSHRLASIALFQGSQTKVTAVLHWHARP
jgi:hypothetical protein